MEADTPLVVFPQAARGDSNPSLHVLMRTKGGHKEGMGDVTSSLALAEVLRSAGHTVLFVTNKNEQAISLVTAAGFRCVAASRLADLRKVVSKPCDVAVLNRLNTPRAEALLFKKSARTLVTIDDTGESARIAHLRFNVLYPIENSFSSFEYIGLAASFRQRHSFPKHIPTQVTNILVTQGGSDTYGFTPRIVEALQSIPKEITIAVVLGPNFYHETSLLHVLRRAPRAFKIIRGERDLSALMMQADVAVTAGGNTLFELACLGVPSVVVCGERFEVATAQRLERFGFGLNLGFGSDITEEEISAAVVRLVADPAVREAMSKRGRRLVDGKGSFRMADMILCHTLRAQGAGQQQALRGEPSIW